MLAQPIDAAGLRWDRTEHGVGARLVPLHLICSGHMPTPRAKGPFGP